MKTTIFVYDAAGKIVAEYSTVVTSSQDAKVAYLTNDHLGSPRINTDQSGIITARHDYHPFGEEIGTLVPPYNGSIHRTVGHGYTADDIRQKFTGYEHDGETDLDFAQARYFNPGVGRFSSPDNFSNDTHVSDPQSWNLFAYVRNNPMKYVDPFGKELFIFINGARHLVDKFDDRYFVKGNDGSNGTLVATLNLLNRLGERFGTEIDHILALGIDVNMDVTVADNASGFTRSVPLADGSISTSSNIAISSNSDESLVVLGTEILVAFDFDRNRNWWHGHGQDSNGNFTHGSSSDDPVRTSTDPEARRMNAEEKVRTAFGISPSGHSRLTPNRLLTADELNDLAPINAPIVQPGIGSDSGLSGLPAVPYNPGPLPPPIPPMPCASGRPCN